MAATEGPTPGEPATPRFQRYPDLASARMGGVALAASDEFFGEKESLLRPERPEFQPDRYTDRGKWVDGWETRRRRGPGHDWVVIRLGARGVIHGVNVDTRHFHGNHPERSAVAACALETGEGERGPVDAWPWVAIVPESPLAPDADNLFAVRDRRPWTHVRLEIFPDGGVARLRVHGIAVAEPGTEGGLVDLAAARSGGIVLAWSDARFGPPHNLLLPDRPPHMGDGWETRRQRSPGRDWVAVRLGVRGVPRRIEVDTTHFKGNYPESFSLDALDDGGRLGDAASGLEAPDSNDPGWREIVPKTPLGPDMVHAFEVPGRPEPATHVRLAIYPDGGVARLRVLGEPL